LSAWRRSAVSTVVLCAPGSTALPPTVASTTCGPVPPSSHRRPAPISYSSRARASRRPFLARALPDAWVDEVTPARGTHEARESIALSFVSAPSACLPSSGRCSCSATPSAPCVEAAEILGTTPASVNSALLRARGSFDPQGTATSPPLPSSAEERALVDRFVQAFENVDVAEVCRAYTRRQIRDATRAHRFRGRPPWASSSGPSSPGPDSSARRYRANGQPQCLLPRNPIRWAPGNALRLGLRKDGVSGITRWRPRPPGPLRPATVLPS